MGVFEFVFGIIVLTLLVGAGMVGLVVWGITKVVKAVSHRLRGDAKETPRMSEGASSSGQRAAEQHEADPPRKARVTRVSHASRPVTGASGRRAQATGNEPYHHEEYVYLDVDAGATPQCIIAVMENYQADSVVGIYAHDIIDALDTAEFRRRSLLSEIDNNFQQGSISWERFAGTATSALDAIVRNCALLANRVQSFDAADYRRIEQYYQTGGMHDAARLQRWKVLQEAKNEMDSLRAVNESLLLELGKLSTELGKLAHSESHDDNSRIAEEIGRLVDETKYYR